MLKKSLVYMFLAAVQIVSVAAADDFSVKNISCALQAAPVPAYENGSSRSGSKNRWLLIKATFVPEELKKAELDSWYDDVTMEGMLVLVREDKNKKDRSYVVMTGETRFATIPADKKEHAGVFYVPPVLLSRYCGGSEGAAKAVEMVRVAFYAPGRILLGEGYWAKSGAKGAFVPPSDSKSYKKIVARMKDFEKAYSNVLQLRGGLYSKEKTPWAYFDYDFYDLIYDNIRTQSGESVKK